MTASISKWYPVTYVGAGSEKDLVSRGYSMGISEDITCEYPFSLPK